MKIPTKFETTMKVQAPTREIEFTLIKSERKSICVQVLQDKSVVVKTPMETSEKEIEELVIRKSRWIAKKRHQMQEKMDAEKKYVNGEYFPYLGEEYPLRVIYNENNKELKVGILHKRLTVLMKRENKELLKRAIKEWYIIQAKTKYFQSVMHYQNIVRRPYKRIWVKEQKTCWGSCTSYGSLNFNWKVVMAPEEVLDYVVVHEMCHLKYMHHGPEFWSEVEKIMPDYRTWKRWLKDNGHKLTL